MELQSDIAYKREFNLMFIKVDMAAPSYVEIFQS